MTVATEFDFEPQPVVTTVTPDGQVTQIALCREEIEDLPPVMREKLKKDLKRPAKKGWFTGKL
jgi:hypothetical protein